MRTLDRWSTRLRRIDPRVFDGALAGVVAAMLAIALATQSLKPGQRGVDLIAYAITAVLGAAVAVHRRHPVAALTVSMVALAAFGFRAYAPFPGLPVFVLLFGLAAHGDRRLSVAALAASAATFALAISVQPASVSGSSTWISTGLALLVAWLWGDNVRSRRARWTALEDRAALLEREREEQASKAVAEERLRIARELHDIVAHAMSVIAVQSGVGHHVIDTQPDEARKALAAIEVTSRSALTEMRRLLGVLRSEGAAPDDLSPAPGLGDVGQLVAQLEDAGVPVHLHVDGTPTHVPPGVDLSAYRIIQEALTNVMKHAGQAAGRVLIRYSDTDVSVEINDNGTAPSPTTDRLYPGHGIIGMRERVAVFGGDFSAGPNPAGGYRVAARLPYTKPAR